MSHPLEERIGALQHRVRRLVTVYGLGWTIAGVLGALIVLGLADYLIRFQDPGIRLICSLLLVGAWGWTVYRYLYLPLMVRLGEVDLAVRLQRRFPELGDRLISSVEFLRQPEDDPIAGSAALRRAVIARTTAEADRLDFSDVLDRRPPIRAAAVTLAVCLVASILVALDPPASRIAVARLANPFGRVSFPRKNHLMLCQRVDRVARGQAFELEVVDANGAKLPKEVRIHYRFTDSEGSVREETELMRFINGTMATRGESGLRSKQRKNGVMVARRENVTRPFSYWVEGGDDSAMALDPIAVQVVEPPEIKSLSIRLTPPQYTGWPPQSSGKHIRALAGTKLEITAKTTKPLRSAVFRLEGDRPVPGRVGEGGDGFTLPAPGAAELVVRRSGDYWLELTDREGLSGGKDARWEILALPDNPPTVTIEQPTANLFVTSRAAVPLRVVTKDDLAVRDVALVFTLPGQAIQDGPGAARAMLPLYTGPQRPPSRAGGGLSDEGESGDRQVIEHRWELEGLGLRPGTQLTFHATATDYQPQTGESQPRRLIVITPEELQQRIADRQSLILAELVRVLKMQRGGRSQVASLQIRLGEVGRLGQQDVDHLQAAELNQRQVRQCLTSSQDGVPSHILALLADLENNKVDGPDVQRRMQALLGEIERLDREHLPLIGRAMTAAIKTAQVQLDQQPPPPTAEQENSQRPRPDPMVAGSLAEAGTHQDAVIASLERMRDQLDQWDNYRRFHREIAQLLRDQEELTGRTSELGRSTLTKELKDLGPQEVADLKVLAGRQRELARQLDRIQQRMQQASVELRQDDPLAAETVADALEEARRLEISGQMRSVGEHLDGNQIGQAVARQKQIAQDLREVLDILANRRRHELARLVEKLREAEADLAELDRRQGDTLKGFQQTAQDSGQNADDARRRELERLAREQSQLQKTTEQFARRLKRLLAEQAGRTAGRAAGQMGQAAQCAAQGDCSGACQGAGEAKGSLEEAGRQLAQRRRQAEAELAVEQLARLEDALKHLQARQQAVIEETQRLDGLRQSQGELTRAQSIGLRDLARQQRSLQADTTRLAEQLPAAGAFPLALSGAGGDMGRAAALLDRRQTGPPTQQAEADALGRLELLLEALKKDSSEEKTGNGPGGAGPGGGKPGGQPPAGARSLPELKLLKLLQQEINLRTQRLQQAVDAAGMLTDEQRREYASLREEQGRLADIVFQLLQPAPEAPEDGLPEAPRDEEAQPRLLPPEEGMP